MTRLVLYGTVCGEPVVLGEDEQAVEETYRSMIRVGWAKEDPMFRRVFTTSFIPDATEEQMRWFDDLQRMSTSPENAVASRIARQQVDLADELPTDHGPDPDPPGDRRPLDDVRQRGRGVARDPGLAARAARQPQPHPARRRAGVADVRREVTAFLEPDRRAWAGRRAA